METLKEKIANYKELYDWAWSLQLVPLYTYYRRKLIELLKEDLAIATKEYIQKLEKERIKQIITNHRHFRELGFKLKNGVYYA